MQTGSINDVLGNPFGDQVFTSNFVIDTLKPTVTNVTSTIDNDSYRENEVIPIEVFFSETVNVTGGTPSLLLDISGVDYNIDYTSGTGTNILQFDYTIQAGHNDGALDYKSTDSLVLNGSAIKDTYGNDATRTLPTPEDAGSLSKNKTITIDTTAPKINSVAVASDNSKVVVVFDEDVYSTQNGTGNLDENDFNLAISPSNATLVGGTSNIKPTSITMDSASNTFSLFLPISGIPDGSEIVTVTPASNAIFDKAGNAALTTQSNNSFNLKDEKLPLLTTVTIAAANDRNFDTEKATEGDVITLTIECNENVTTPTVAFTSGNASIHGTVTVTGAAPGKNFEAKYKVNSADNDGDVGFSITGFTDSNNNTGNEVTVLTSGSTVVVDKVLPTLTSVTYSTNNSSGLYSKVDDIITLNITASENITAPTVDFKSGGSTTETKTMKGSGQTYDASYQIAQNNNEGNIGFIIRSFEDETGNSGSNVVSVTSGAVLQFDKTVPTFTTTTVTSNNPTNTLAKEGNLITLTLQSDASLSAPPTVEFTSGGQTASAGTVITGSTDSDYTAIYAVSNSHNDGVIGFTISNFSDLAGNPGTTVTATTSEVTVDKEAPTISSVAIDANNSILTLEFSEDVYSTANGSGDIATNDLSLSLTGGTAELSTHIPGSVSSIGNDKKTFNVVVSSIIQGSIDGTEILKVELAPNSVFDKAGNIATIEQLNNTVQLKDKSKPSMTSLKLSSNNPFFTNLAKENEEVTLTMVADEEVTPPTVVFKSGNNDIPNTRITVTPSTGTNTDYTAKYTVNASDTNGSVSFEVSAFQDGNNNVGNTSTAVTDSSSVTIDTTSPTLSKVVMTSSNILNNSLAKSGETVTLDISVNEHINTPSISFSSDNQTITGPITITGENDSYTAQFGVNASDKDGPVSFTISNISDSAGNVLSDVTTLTSGTTVTIDKTAPSLSTVTLQSNNIENTDSAKSGDSVELKIIANEDITTPQVQITSGDVSVNNAISVEGTGQNYTASYTVSSSDVSGSVAFIIENYTDLAGNAGPTVKTTTDSSNVTVDLVSPILTTVSIASDNATNTLAKASDTITLTINASEDISAPTVSFSSGGTLVTGPVTVSKSSNTSYNATYPVNTSDKDGLCTFTISGYKDNAGNQGPGVISVTNTSSVTIDTTPPTVKTIIIDPSLVSLNGNTTATITFTEPVTGFTLADITPTQGTLSDFNEISNDVYTVKYTPDSGFTSSSAQTIIQIGNDYTDLAGNSGVTSSFTSNQLFTVANDQEVTNIFDSNIDSTITDSNVNSTVEENTGQLDPSIDSIVETIVNNEEGNLKLEDLSEAQKQALIDALIAYYARELGVDPSLIEIELSDGSIIARITIKRPGVATGSNIVIDSDKPTVTTFTLSDTILKTGESATVNLTFSEQIDTSTLSASEDFTAPGGAITSLQTTDNGTNWTGTFTPSTNTEVGTSTLSIGTTYKDVAGNEGEAAQSSTSYTVDTLAPSVSQFNISDRNLTKGESAILTIVFSEPVVDFALEDLSVANGEITDLDNPSRDNKTWTAVFTPSGTTLNANTVISLDGNYKDEVGNVGESSQLSLAVDTAGETKILECIPKNINNNELTGVKSMPLKDSTSNNDSSFSMGRKLYSSRMMFTNMSNSNKQLKNWSMGRDASSVISRRKAESAGASMNLTGGLFSFTNSKDTNVIDRALQRARSGGSRVPKK